MLKAIKKIFRKKKPVVVVDRQAELKNSFPDFDDAAISVIESVEPYTMTSPERIHSLCDTVKHITTNKIDGDVVECGVWRGGSMMATALSLLQANSTDRHLHLFDTFEGMPPADDVDRDFMDTAAAKQLSEQDKADPKSIWCYSSIDEVKNNMAKTSYPAGQISFVQGKVEETLCNSSSGDAVQNKPDRIALLRLDTDWYESTKVCLEELYPRLVDGGVLIIDDYGHWKGCRKAVDEYFIKHGIPIFLQRIDYTGRIAVKPTNSAPQKQAAA